MKRAARVVQSEAHQVAQLLRNANREEVVEAVETNTRRWRLTLACAHVVVVTSVERPKFARCRACMGER